MSGFHVRLGIDRGKGEESDDSEMETKYSGTTESDYSDSDCSGSETSGSYTSESYTSGSGARSSGSATTKSASTKSGSRTRSQSGGHSGPLYVMRHGERLDRIFPDWMRQAFVGGVYRPYDLNQPVSLPTRTGGAVVFRDDPPLTEIGKVCSQMVGRGLRKRYVRLAAVYCSPALRCVQTTAKLLAAAGQEDEVRVEPGLFDWMGSYDKQPTWMSMAELTAAGLPVDTQYEPVVSVEQMASRCDESSADFYARTNHLVRALLRKTPRGAVLIVGHAATVDAACRPLLKKPATTMTRAEMDRVELSYPYCSLVALEPLSDDTWSQLANPLPSITYLDLSSRIDHQYLTRV